MKGGGSVGISLLGVWLLLVGLSSPPIHLSFAGFALIQGILALVAGILILARR
jgi:hypothetical protein